MENEPTRLKRWEFRKKKKLEKRREKRQLNAKQHETPKVTAPTNETEKALEQQDYLKAKAMWEEREEKFHMLAMAKKAAREKQEKAKALSQKRWQDTLLNLPLMPPNFTVDKKSTLKTFVQSNQEPVISHRKTYRERFLEKKFASDKK
ncbi:hypothetical protein INT47_006966 [Mucor saturninus]|uniref:Uncharacterized protein n=1 Tax=Mucor saturninus TaxID=64648 RepID=A0A8H7QJD7_9FUNG|nr:hypothetical protein INT47_006966 [Mucor saturninus]